VDKAFAAQFRKRLWEEHLGVKVSADYQPRDADHFRRLAGKAGRGASSRIRFFPGYELAKRGVPTWFPFVPPPKNLRPEGFKAQSVMVASFSPQLRYNLPVALLPAAFQVHVLPALPTGYRAWYRWKCELFYDPSKPEADQRTDDLRMRSTKNDLDEVYEYSDQSSAYIGAASARYIDQRVRDVAPGRVICRVQLVPLTDGPDPLNINYPSFRLEYECAFMNARFARANLDPSLLPTAP